MSIGSSLQWSTLTIHCINNFFKTLYVITIYWLDTIYVQATKTCRAVTNFLKILQGNILHVARSARNFIGSDHKNLEP